MSIGNYKTKKKAENRAKLQRRRNPKYKPVRVVKRDIGWDVMMSRPKSG